MRGVFITGTDTGVGKTLFAAALLRQLRALNIQAAACKPVAAGCRREHGRLINPDAELLAASAAAHRPLAIVNPVALEPPIAPHIAAADAGVSLDAQHLVAACRMAARGAHCLVVEGAGGWRVPLGARQTLADVARGLGLPVVLVVGLRLGCLNHALLTAEAIARDGLALAGWVANVLAADLARRDENVAFLTSRLGASPLVCLPQLDGSSETRRARLAADLLPPELPARLGLAGAPPGPAHTPN